MVICKKSRMLKIIISGLDWKAGGFCSMDKKSPFCSGRAARKPARQGSKNANKGAYPDVSNRNLHLQLTQQAKIPPNFLSFRGIFAFAGFVSGLRRGESASP